MKINYSPFVTLALAARSQATIYPIGITNCGLQSWIKQAPKRAVTLNQGTTEIMLALGLVDSMVGTAYLDDEIWPEIADDYAKIPVLSSTYPDIETLMEVEPDFLYASYRSAFQASTKEDDNRIDYFQIVEACNMTLPTSKGNATYCRSELNEANIQTYLQAPYCELADHRPAELQLSNLYEEIWEIANIFDAFPKAQSLVSQIEEHFRQATNLVYLHNTRDSAVSVFWLDGWDDVSPFVGACCGSINTIIEYAGAKNIFENKGIEEKKSWDHVSWSEVAEKDPDVIIVVDASWDAADEKIYNLCKNETTRNLRAVQNRHFITVPFSATTLGVRVGSLSFNLAEAIVAMANGEPLSTLDFTETSITNDGNVGRQALGKSGARAYTRLPIFTTMENETIDLETFCPGGPENNIVIADDSPFNTQPMSAAEIGVTESGEKVEVEVLPQWGIGLIAFFGVVAIGIAGFVLHMIRMEKNGKPLFVSSSGVQMS